ncbi:MAG: serine/threonine-protein kinase [Planctomycetota bacterium]|nr:serine/threonine-protein kinase [Planctomycetota bacterium]MDA1213349.1 serine/threonine-protein kinase [Planctomycetota bacterium]
MTIEFDAGEWSFDTEIESTPTWGLSDYEMLQLVSRGAIADVWQVRDSASGEAFALKQLREEWAEDPTACQILKNELEVAAAVQSPYVVRVWETPVSFERPAVLMEWLGENTLARHLDVVFQMPVRESLWIARQCALGLKHLIDAGFVHGDIKPENIALLPGGAIKLIDLGFAQPVARNSEIPRSDIFTGTITYTAPEAFTSECSSVISRDLYSLGILLYRLLTGHLPFQGKTTAEVMRQHREQRPPLLLTWCPEASDEVVAFVNRLLAKHPLRRPADIDQVVQELIRLELLHWPETSLAG